MKEWQWEMVNIFVVIFESFFLYYWCFSEKFSFRCQGIKKWLLMMVFPIATYGLDFVCSNPTIKMSILLVVGIIMIYIMYECTILQSLIRNVFFMFLLIVSESISMGFLLFTHGEGHISLFLEQSPLRIQCIVLSKLINVIILVFSTKLLNIERKRHTIKEVGVLLLQAISSILCLIMIVEFSYYQTELFSWSMPFLVFLGISVLISYIVSYYLTEKYFSSRDREEEILLIAMKNEKIMNDYKSLESNQQKIYQLYHDIKKHLNVINMMDNKKEINTYLEKCFGDIGDIDGMFQTGNQYIDMILYDEWKKAQELGIKAQFAVEKGSLDKIELHDVIIILGNALENAREACEKKLEAGETAHIQLKVVKKSKQVFIVLSNDYVGDLIRTKNIFPTSKKDKDLHGIGMKSIRSSVEKYKGHMDVSLKEQKFILKIMINLSELEHVE